MRKRFLCFACLHVCELVWMKVLLTKIFANEVQYAKRQNLIIVLVIMKIYDNTDYIV